MDKVELAGQCPLCLQQNGCAMANHHQAGQNEPSPCWCQSVPESITAVLSQYTQSQPQLNLPDNQCICQQCIEKILAAMTINAVQQYQPDDH
ncbi:cysteine-rich CWC family protein [Shewanella saliphila]|uniref:Cysteine-rich CWC family protein n=1 Tax=Shewanella saliphila TaxID=2282698 RepID=A0ABQ2Q3U8_9GAMM|nr:cysteine-rich CWC family protein [Shewanella saliphila]MCL1101486.1 cysteine-rich CWC family protein [Shewanella saliphila]GGP46930.1 hypothetical protein GCM10009409_11950 [Shewanella saliphila]